MTDIAQLESRITQALARIRAGIESGASTSGGGDLARQLSEEQTANAQLQERVRALKERQDSMLTSLEEKVSSQKANMVALEAELQRLRASNADLQEVTSQLRASASEGATEAELLNRALMAEVEALTAQRAADVAQMDAILSELKPLLVEG